MSKIYLEARAALSLPFQEEDLVMIEVDGIKEPAISFDAINKRVEDVTGEPLRINQYTRETAKDGDFYTVVLEGSSSIAGVQTPTIMGVGEDKSKAKAYNKAHGSLFARISQFLGMKPTLEQRNIIQTDTQGDLGTSTAITRAQKTEQRLDKVRMEAKAAVVEQEPDLETDVEEKDTNEGEKLGQLLAIEAKYADIDLSALPSVFKPEVYIAIGNMKGPESKEVLEAWGFDIVELSKSVSRWTSKYSQEVLRNHYELSQSEVTKAVSAYNLEQSQQQYTDKVVDKIKSAPEPVTQEMPKDLEDAKVFPDNIEEFNDLEEEVEEEKEEAPAEDHYRLEHQRNISALNVFLNSLKDITVAGEQVVIAGSHDYLNKMPEWVIEKFPTYIEFAKYAHEDLLEAIK